MAKVDFNSLDIDTRIGRKRQICGKCGELMAVTTICPLREKREVTIKKGFKKIKKKLNPVVCWHCCNYECKHTINTPAGKVCKAKLNKKKKAEQERQKAAKAEKKKPKAMSQYDDEAQYSFFNMPEEED